MVKGLEIEDLPAIINYLSSQIKKLGVTVRALDRAYRFELIEKLKPDVMVVATGGIPRLFRTYPGSMVLKL